MAKLKSPLFSLQARGSLGPRLTFCERPSGSHVRFQRAQYDYENAERQPIRQAFRLGIELWNYLPEAEKEYWRQVDQKGYADV